VADVVIERFNRQALEAGDTRVLDLRFLRVAQQQLRDGVWRLSIEFLARLARASGGLS